ncbi:MAG TPA: AAA family ATPase [Candidatus Coprenecus avistercoris]|uniref:AAA family ATPase n=1 Tax=Candidatus Coprenecus avistercoris TaxID=2840730 RepID=A0A9D1E0D9_9BACT|nr:AAA family ATPase [Candidatus Coprenecus avistercoris]
MDYTDIQPLLNTFHRKLAATDLRFKRYLHGQINWDARLLGIKGARGVGKTTMLLQHIKETAGNNLDEVFYASLDNMWFQTHSAEDLVEFLYTRGVTRIYLDEVHKYRNWTVLLKNLYDNYPGLNIVYTGSAMLAIDNSKSDLSRRQSLYTLHGLSFREYLEYEGIISLPSMTLEEMLNNHVSYAMDITSAGIKIVKYFEQYLNEGYYPYYKEAGRDYLMRIGEVVQLVIDSDITAVEETITYSTRQKIKKLLMVVAENVPLEPNINKLAASLESTRDQTLKMLYWLDRAALLWLLTDKPKDYKHLTGPKKIYLNNTNLMNALGSRVSKGTQRETFFANQAGAVTDLLIPKQGDFLADGRYIFEVGGPQKTFDQIAGLPDSYLAIDDIEIGNGNRIPLWLFGCLY